MNGSFVGDVCMQIECRSTQGLDFLHNGCTFLIEQIDDNDVTPFLGNAQRTSSS